MLRSRGEEPSARGVPALCEVCSLSLGSLSPQQCPRGQVGWAPLFSLLLVAWHSLSISGWNPVIDSSGSRLPDVTVEINLERPTSIRIKESWIALMEWVGLQGWAVSGNLGPLMEQRSLTHPAFFSWKYTQHYPNALTENHDLSFWETCNGK